MSKTKGGGSTKNGRDSESKRLGVKVFDGGVVNAGSIIVRQRGTKSTPASTSAAAATTRSSPSPPARVKFGSRKGKKLVDVLTD